MCGGVRGVGAGGIVSSAFCLLYKLFTLRLTRKQLIGLITHSDSPYIRGLGFMYIRYTQPPADLWDWYEDYLYDEEEVDVKAGGGHVITIGDLVRQYLVKLEWYSTLFPRIPVPVQKVIQEKLRENPPVHVAKPTEDEPPSRPEHPRLESVSFGEAERVSHKRHSPSDDRRAPPRHRSPRRSPPRRSPQSSSSRRRSPRPSPVQRSPHHRSPRRSPPRRSPPSRHHSPPRRDRYHSHDDDFARQLERERKRQQREKDKVWTGKDHGKKQPGSREKRRSRSKSRERKEKSKHRSRSRSRSRAHKHRDRGSGDRNQRLVDDNGHC
ncbi:pre-mRNA-splicing factor 38B-like isoform X2 [Gigantopelta aegis]|nr:pre-mRNA-splicing factor 38B-like isoform X2 [Gigantopelta aegis]